MMPTNTCYNKGEVFPVPLEVNLTNCEHEAAIMYSILPVRIQRKNKYGFSKH